MLNPDCTPGWVNGADGGYVGCCGCGWSSPVQPSKTKAKAAQRAHRFPPQEPPATAALERTNLVTQPVSTAGQSSRLERSDSLPIVTNDMNRHVTSDGALIEEGVCRDCGRLLYRAFRAGDLIDTWHPSTVLAGAATNRFDGTHVISTPGRCSGETHGPGRPSEDAFVIGIPLTPIDDDGPLGCYICGDPTDHASSDGDLMECPTELTRAAADALRALVGLDTVKHPRRRDDRV